MNKIAEDKAIVSLIDFVNNLDDLDDIAELLSRYCENGKVVVVGDGTESEMYFNGNHIRPASEPSIKANCHSDDRHVDVEFDAAQWFAQASGRDIYALAECGWGGDYPGDSIAQYEAEHNEEINGMFIYIEINGGLGFECSVDAEQAMAWLDVHKPELAAELREDPELDLD